MQLAELRDWPARKSQLQLVFRGDVPLKLTAHSTKETAGGGGAGLELSWLLALPSLLLQQWWQECKNVYCRGSDSPESSSKIAIFNLIFLFPVPSLLFSSKPSF